ncbi:MAG: sigma-54-dependent Fis family transcriptional regulator [Magnetococcales bacterium]|nr:sigma-54-dependent Fis family transcriptional regulator [Magnetococcales bacterium]
MNAACETSSFSSGEPAAPVFVVDDEEDTLRGMRLLLRREGLEPVVTIQDSREVMPMLQQQTPVVVLLDLNMPHIAGLELLSRIKEHAPDLPVIVVTAVQEIATAVECMRQGAEDYLLKPVEEERLISAVRRAKRAMELTREVRALRGYLLGGALANPDAFAHIVTGSRRIEDLFKYLEAVARTGESLLITGETGTGKELFAQAFHALRGRKGAFVAVNVAGLDEHMFADTLFGHRRGAFTGADQPRDGMVARAARGTLFLDEIGDLAPGSQVKLLRLLQERKYEPLGSDLSRNSEVTVVAATNRDLKQMAMSGKFRLDLYYRLATHAIHLPPLRERREDLAPLLKRFLAEAARSMGKAAPPTVPRELLVLLAAHAFPGNVRELRAMVFDAVATHKRGMLSLASFRKAMGMTEDSPAALTPRLPALSWQEGSPPPTLKEAEAFLIHHAMTQAKGNQKVAAAMLGLTRQALNQRLTRRGGWDAAQQAGEGTDLSCRTGES